MTPETDRERQIIEMYLAGKTYREIDAALRVHHAIIARVVRRHGHALRGRPPAAVDRKRECLHCARVRWHAGRGLCKQCHNIPSVRELYPRAVEEYHEPTEEELDRMIAEQMQCLPPWWESESELADVGCPEGTRKKRVL